MADQDPDAHSDVAQANQFLRVRSRRTKRCTPFRNTSTRSGRCASTRSSRSSPSRMWPMPSAAASSRRSTWSAQPTGGPLQALSGVEAQRQAADDETAIRLNPTMVGFGAGQSTFGWIFYPRLQTSGGKRGPALHRHRAPGQRPRARPDRQRPEHRARPARMHRAGRNAQLRPQDRIHHRGQLVPHQRGRRRPEVRPRESRRCSAASSCSAEEALEPVPRSRATIAPKSYQIATERLNQLRSLMPTQRMVVRVPFADNQNDARIFCSHGSQLRPTLLGLARQAARGRAENRPFFSRARTSAFTTPT